jgi:hypothetical protein
MVQMYAVQRYQGMPLYVWCDPEDPDVSNVSRFGACSTQLAQVRGVRIGELHLVDEKMTYAYDNFS